MQTLVRIAMIVEALREPSDQPRPLFDLAQQHSARVGRDRPAIEFSDDFPPTEGLQLEQLILTLCFHRTASVLAVKC